MHNKNKSRAALGRNFVYGASLVGALAGIIVALPVAAQQQSGVGTGDASQALSEETRSGRPLSAIISVGVEQSDNAFQSATGERNSTQGIVGLNANYYRDGRTLDYGVVSNLDYIKYSEEGLGSSARGALDAYLDYGAEDAWLRWLTHETFQQSLLQPFANETANNLESVNTIGTGPSLSLRVGPRTVLRADGQYSKTSYEDSLLDSDRVYGSVSAIRAFGHERSLALQAASARTRYDDSIAAFADYDIRELFLSYQDQRNERLIVNADAGVTQLESLDTKQSDPLVRLRIERQLGRATGVFLNAQQAYSSAAELSTSTGVRGSPQSRGTPVSAAGAAKTRSIDLGFLRSGLRNSVDVQVGTRKETYDAAALFDRSSTRFNVTMNRRLRLDWRGSLSLELRREKEANLANSSATYQDVQLRLSRLYGRRLSVSGTYNFLHRTDDAGSAFEFTENRIGLFVNYALIGRDGGE